MSAAVYIYPGTFSPPTHGHLEVVRQAMKICERLIIICSRNQEKESWFTAEECKNFWLAYNLPKNVEIMTLEEFSARSNSAKNVVMIRGLRGKEDLAHENKVIILNKENYGIKNFLFIFTSDEYASISSTKAREAAVAHDVLTLEKMVAKTVATALLQHAKGGR